MRQLLVLAALTALANAPLASGQPATVKRAITDPILKRDAFYVNVPQNWQFDGAIVPGSTCETFPTAVFRASSPDGLTGVYALPRLDWSWATPKQIPPVDGCMPWAKKVTAKEILNYMVPILHVAFDREGDPAVVAQLNTEAKRTTDKLNATPGSNMTFSTDVARFMVRHEIDHHPIEETLDASVNCSDAFHRDIGWHVYKCSAYMTRKRAPLGKLTEQAAVLQSVQGTFDKQWNEQWMALWTDGMRKRMDAMYRPQTAALLEAGKRAGDARMQQHQAFMNSMQQQRDVRNYNFVAGQYNKQYSSDNFVDYILDCTRLQNGVSVGKNCPNRQTAP